MVRGENGATFERAPKLQPENPATCRDGTAGDQLMSVLKMMDGDDG